MQDIIIALAQPNVPPPLISSDDVLLFCTLTIYIYVCVSFFVLFFLIVCQFYPWVGVTYITVFLSSVVLLVCEWASVIVGPLIFFLGDSDHRHFFPLFLLPIVYWCTTQTHTRAHAPLGFFFCIEGFCFCIWLSLNLLHSIIEEERKGREREFHLHFS